MAILEVHDGRGRVERVSLTRDEPFIFGSSPACTVVLNDPSIALVHGRIRWQKRKYKIDAGAEVDALEVNGKRIKSSTLYQGDEIRVGSSRIFVISTEEHDAAREDDKTRIQAAPKAQGLGAGKGSPRPAAFFEADSVAEVLDGPTRFAILKRKHRSKERLEAAVPAAVATTKGKRHFGGWLLSRLLPTSDAPGEERVISSPMVVGLTITLAIFLIASFGLWKVIVKSSAQRQYTKAFDTLNEGDYRNAIKQLEQFLAAYPEDPRSAKASVYRSLAKVRQFTSNTGASWENALQAAQAMVSEVGDLEAYRDASTELAEQLVKTVEGLADRARASADPAALTEAESALALHAQVAGQAGKSAIARSRAPIKLSQAREAIRRAQTKAKAMASLNAALASGSADKAYAARDGLVATYPDMASDRELVAGLVKANELIRKAVSFDSSQRPGETEPHPDPLGPPTTLVLRLEPGRPPVNAGSVVYAVADGLAYGLDGATGAPLWQVAVGLSSAFPPLPILGGDPAVLVNDARYDELVRLDGRTGKLIWRQELGDDVTEPPLVSGNSIIMATPGGKILFLDLSSGSLRGVLDLGRPLARSPVADESGLHLYVLGEEDCLFVLDRDPPACVAVEYLGHKLGSIACSPTRVGRFLVVPENSTLKDGRWRVFVLDEAGSKVTPKQTIPVAGWTWQTPASSGSVIWSASDRHEIVAYSIGLYEEANPFKPIASIAADTMASGPAFAIARSARELWTGSGRPGRFDLDDQTGKVSATWVLGQSGPALAPVQVADKMAVFTQQSLDGPGTALTAVNPQNGSVVWRTTLGAPWPVSFVSGKSEGSIESLGFDGELMSLGRGQLEGGGFVEQPLSKPGTFRVPSLDAAWFACGESIVMIPSTTADHILVRVGTGKFRAIDLPSPLGARPIAWGKDVLIPASDGRVYLIDPVTGDFAADPFVPRFDKAHPSHWRMPVLLDGDAVALADGEGHIRRLTKVKNPRPRLVVTAEASLGKPIVSELASTGGAVQVATSDGKIRSLSARDLSAASMVDLTSPRTRGPVAAGGHAFVSDAAGDVIVFAADGRRLWSTKLQSPMSDAPAVFKGAAWFLTRSGSIESRNLADGSWVEQLRLGFLPAGPPLACGTTLVVPSGLGSFRAIITRQGPQAAAPGEK